MMKDNYQWLEDRLYNVEFTLLKYRGTSGEYPWEEHALVQLESELVVWKKVRRAPGTAEVVIALGLLPDTWMVLHKNDMKCRVNWALVQAEQPEGEYWYPDSFLAPRGFRYHPGQVVQPHNRFPRVDRWWRICAPGIHCFLTKTRAQRYLL